MTTLPAVLDAEDAAGLLSELFSNPPPAALTLATSEDAGPANAVLRWLLVTLPDLPADQSRLLRAGAGRLLGKSALCGYVICLLEGDGSEAAAEPAAAVVSGGTLRGVAATAAGGPDLHALLLGLCARLGASPTPAALARDLADPRYRDLCLLLAAAASPATLTDALPPVAATLDPTDDYAVEALGRALREALQRHGEEAVLAVCRGAGDAAALLRAGLREALVPARLAWLTDAQREQELAAIQRHAGEQPGDAYLRLRLDAPARQAFLDRAERILAGE